MRNKYLSVLLFKIIIHGLLHYSDCRALTFEDNFMDIASTIQYVMHSYVKVKFWWGEV